jgi:outer membrane protein
MATYRLHFIIFFCFFIVLLSGQNSFTLETLLADVKAKSLQNKLTTSEWKMAEADMDFFKASLKPQVTGRMTLPNFLRTSNAVTQPNGSIAFQPVFQNNASFSLLVEQAFLPTGGTFFMQTDIQRFDDFSSKYKVFNGVPIRLGYTQSLIGYNPLKWNKIIAEKRWETARFQYNFDIESSFLNAITRYFDVLIAETNVAIATKNKEANEKLLLIADERLALGKISRDEKLQMETEYKNALMLESQAGLQLERAKLEISNLFSENVANIQNLEVPTIAQKVVVSEEKSITLTLTNAPALLEAERLISEAEMEKARRKAEWGIQVNVFAAIGLARGAETASEIYTNPFNEQQLNVSLTMPLVDWGRRKSTIKAADEMIYQAKTQVIQQKQQLTNLVRQRVFQINELQSRLAIQKDILAISEERYNISAERYVAGVLTITDLILSQRNKDQTRREYLMSLHDFFVAYYDLRRLTGYDFMGQKPINY